MTADSASAAPRLSLCMIVRNERDRLPACLRSVQGVVDEIVVVDTGSTDGTPELARSLGAEVVQTEWTWDFSAARNAGLDRAHGAWIFAIDADETLAPASRAALRAIARRAPVEAFHVRIRHAVGAGDYVRGAAVRIFPNRPDVRFHLPLHEEVNGGLRRAGIPMRTSSVELFHEGYVEPERIQEKIRRNRDILEAALTRRPSPEDELLLRYYYASSFYDTADWARAAAEFEWCIGHAPATAGGVARSATIRAAECHFELGDLSRAQTVLPAAPDAAQHPALLHLGAGIARKRGHADTARLWSETLLSVPDTVFLPPVALGELKAAAFDALAAHWTAQGRADLGTKLNALARALRQREIEDIGPEMAARYLRLVVAGNTPAS